MGTSVDQRTPKQTLEKAGWTASLPYKYVRHPHLRLCGAGRHRGQRDWRGQIPGEWTANDAGVVVELYIETLDAKGPLLMVGSATAPMVRDIAPGQVDRSSPPPLSPWVVWTGAGTTAVLLAAGSGFGAGMSAVQADYTAQANLAITEPQDGAVMRQKRELGEGLSITANSLFIAGAVTGLATVVAGAFFTDWDGRGSTEDDAPAPTPANAE